jgi:predicted nucleic acid-binding protein
MMMSIDNSTGKNKEFYELGKKMFDRLKPLKKSNDDDDIQDYVSTKQVNEVYEKIRNNTLEEVAQEFDKMKSFGDTSASFAVYVRGMKR